MLTILTVTVSLPSFAQLFKPTQHKPFCNELLTHTMRYLHEPFRSDRNHFDHSIYWKQKMDNKIEKRICLYSKRS